MDSEHINVEWILSQLTLANWHLDRASGAGVEASRQDVMTARETYTNLTRMLPEVVMENQQIQRIRAQLADLKERLLAMEGKM